MRRSGVERFNRDPAARDRHIVEVTDDHRHRDKRRQRTSVRGDTLEPRDLALMVRGHLSAVVVVSLQVLVNRRVWMVIVGVVPMRLRQRRGEGKARRNAPGHDRRAN
jgi:hypothetical protein